MTVSEARMRWAEVVEGVMAGDEVTLTRHGEPVAVIVRPEVLRTRRVTRAHADAAELSAALDRMRDVPLDRLPDVGSERAKTLVRAARAARAAR